MEWKGCLEGCYHVGNVKNRKHKFKIKKYKKTTKPKIKLRDLQEVVNKGEPVNYDFWNAVLS
ncbi:hypothetical protein L6259_00165 [Candidatus Parcubacteria bacterium]|nr:hypothetical protein [Candidatus Parcubacteria bacterium]